MPTPAVPTTKPMDMRPETTHRVSAVTYSDDRVFQAEFDAARALAACDDACLQALADCGWGGDYAADDIARDAGAYDAQVKRVFDYLDLRPTAANGDTIGFECRLNERDVKAWITAERPHLLGALFPDG
jgi:hypothetical protein